MRNLLSNPLPLPPPGSAGGVEDLIGLDVHALNHLKDNGFSISDDKVLIELNLIHYQISESRGLAMFVSFNEHYNFLMRH